MNRILVCYQGSLSLPPKPPLPQPGLIQHHFTWESAPPTSLYLGHGRCSNICRAFIHLCQQPSCIQKHYVFCNTVREFMAADNLMHCHRPSIGLDHLHYNPKIAAKELRLEVACLIPLISWQIPIREVLTFLATVLC